MLLTQYQASQLPGAPDRTQLYVMVNSENPPSFAVPVEGKIMVNTEDESWKALLLNKVFNSDIKKVKATKQESSDVSPEMLKLEMKSRKAKALHPVLRNRALHAKLKEQEILLKIKLGDLIDFKTAEYLFFGYMEKINLELMSLTKKIKPIIDSFVNEKNSDGLITHLLIEYKSILHNVKENQAKDVQSWRKELVK